MIRWLSATVAVLLSVALIATAIYACARPTITVKAEPIRLQPPMGVAVIPLEDADWEQRVCVQLAPVTPPRFRCFYNWYLRDLGERRLSAGF